MSQVIKLRVGKKGAIYLPCVTVKYLIGKCHIW